MCRKRATLYGMRFFLVFAAGFIGFAVGRLATLHIYLSRFWLSRLIIVTCTCGAAALTAWMLADW
jgi:hypothetical protein